MYIHVYSYPIMALKRIEEHLSRLERLVNNWNREGGMSRIERDMALEELRRIYDAILDYEPAEQNNNQAESTPAVVIPPVAPPSVEEAAVEEVVAEEPAEDVKAHAEKPAEEVKAHAEEPAEEVSMPVAVSADEVGDAFDDALDIDALLGLTGDDPIVEEPQLETPIIEDAVEQEEPEQEEPEQEHASEPIVAEESAVEKPIGGGLFDIDDIPVRKTHGRRMISLYNEPVTPVEPAESEPEQEESKPEPAPAPEPVPAPKPAPVPAPEPQPQPQRLGDVIAKDVKVLGDKMAVEEQPTAFNRIKEIRKAIGLNDRFLLIRDLFGGDATLYDQTITRLDEFDDLDDCMIYIVENFRWNPDSAGAKLLVSLIERKLC